MQSKIALRRTILAGTWIAYMLIMCFLIPTRIFAADFTAVSLGEYGNVTVMETSGNYDANNPDGTVNAVPRQVIANEFFKTHKDDYDFVVIFSNFDFTMPADGNARGFYTTVKNDTYGLGIDQIDNTNLYNTTLNGSSGRLQGTIDMGNLSKLVSDPLDPKFKETLYVLSHEIMHRWAARVKFKDLSNNNSSALLGKDGSHWSFLLDSGGSLMYGNRWQDNGNGTFTSLMPQSEQKFYSPLDLYLMGMIDKSRVPPMLLIDSPGVDAAQLPQAGVTITGTARTVTIDDIISAMGPRVPDAASSQKSFKTAFIFVTRPGTFAGDDLYKIENVRNGAVTRFSILTDGNAIMQVASTPKEDIPSNPGVLPPSTTPRMVSPNINEGVQWLMAAQQAGGSWVDLAQTMERDTAETTIVLRSFATATENYQKALLWLGSTQSVNLDYLTRKIQALAGAGQVVAPLVQDLLSRQNTDGGWGSGETYESGNADTALVLLTLSATGYSDQAVLSRAINYLKSKQNDAGGWGSEDKGGMVQETSNVLSAFNKYRTAYQLDEAITKGTTWLVSKQNPDPDGGFGNSPSTVYDTAVATLALRELNVSTDITNKALAYLLGQQSENGSWNNSAYQTALAVNAIFKATIDPDLSITPDDITIIPDKIRSLPSNIVINANIRNLGQTAATATVFLYEGSISDQNKIGEQTLTFPGQQTTEFTTVTFSATARDGNEHRFTIVVDPDNQVKESSELNNTAVKMLYPEATYDLEVLPGDVTVAPGTTDMLQDVRITARISNKGTMNAYNVKVRYFIDIPGAPFELATLTIDMIPANGAVTRELTWRANKAGTDMLLTVQADPYSQAHPEGEFTELSETNNTASTILTVNTDARPNLAVSYKDLVITPSSGNERGTVTISALVKNDGFSPANNIAVRFYRGVPCSNTELAGTTGNSCAQAIQIGTQQAIATLGPGENSRVSVDWVDIPESGKKLIYVEAYTETAISEIADKDNYGFVNTLTLQSLPDLAVSTNSIVFSPAAPKEGDTVAITVTVQNKGEQAASNVAVRLSEGSVALGNDQTIPSLVGGGTSTVLFSYDTAVKGAHTFTAVVDPGNTITEQSKDNNSASRTLGVQDSSLWVTEKYISPNGDGVKDSTALFFRLEAAATVSIHIVNKKKETVRTFTGPELMNTTSGSIVWNGLNDSGVVVDDGEYQLQLLNSAGTVLAKLQVTVDNNRSPLTDAIGTGNLLNNNLSCMLPDIWDGASNEFWRWFPDESGILFDSNAAYNQNTPEFPSGIYTMAPDGQDILMVSPPAWSESRESNCTEQNPCTRSTYSNYKISSDSSTIAVIITQETYTHIWAGSWYGWYWTWIRTLNQFWVMDRDGNNKVLIGSYDPSQTSILDFAWSPRNDYLVYRLDNAGTTEKLKIVRSDGTADSDREIDSGGYFDFNYLKWSPDGNEIAYIYGIYDNNLNYIQKARVSDLSGSKNEIYSLDADALSTYIGTYEWLGSDKIVIGTYGYWQNQHPLLLVDKNGSENTTQLSAEPIEVSVSPDRKHCAFTEYQDNLQKIVVKIADDKGNMSLVHEEANAFLVGEGNLFSVSQLIWSPDGRIITAVDMAFGKVPACPAYDSAINLYEPHLVTFDLSSKVKKDFKISEPSCFLNYDCMYSGIPACYVEKGPRFEKTISFFKDNLNMLVEDESGYFEFNIGTGSRSGYLPIQNGWYTNAKLSPLGGYLTYYQPVDQSSTCYGRGGLDLWAISSPLNLTAELRATKSKAAVILKGIATDLNFASYQLEYVDIKLPDVWSLVQPSSSVPVINDVFTTWVPPYEGSFYVRLTVWDKAGNTAVSKKRISWSQYSSITNLYKSNEIFSPNGDGVKDTVELHYRVLEPAHLEFNIYDAENNLVKTYYKDHAAPIEDFIQWDGTDQSFNTVPDGKYKIKVFDYEFFVEVDSTAPDANIELSPIIKTSEIFMGQFFSGEVVYKVLALGFAYDKNIKKWTVDYGVGDNPQEWHTLREGGTALVKKDTEGNPLLKPLENDTIDQFAFSIAKNNATGKIIILNSIEYLVGNKYRITAEDLAGNKITRISNMLEEKVFTLYSSDCPAFPRFVLETVKTPINNIVLQSFNDKWEDIETKSYPSNEETVTIPYFRSSPKGKLRLKVVDIYDNEYISNEGGCHGDGGGGNDDGASELKLHLTVAYKDGRCDVDSGAGSAEIEAFVEPRDTITFKTLSYYVEKPSGTELLRQYDLTREKWGKVGIDTSALQEGGYSVKAVLAYVAFGQTAIVESSVYGTLIVEHVLPTAQITYPTKSVTACPMKAVDVNDDWYGLPIEGMATDNNSVQYYELYYGVGENPAVWLPAMTRINGKRVAIKETKTVQGQLGVWDVTDLRGTAYSLKLKVVDVVGNVSCYTTSFSIDTLTEITNLTIDKKLISPNVGGNVNVGYQIDEYATVAVKVFKLIQKADGSYGLDNAPVRTITAAKEHLGGSDSTAWDGKPDGGTTAPDGKDDGKYGIVVYATDFCGNTAQKWVAVEVDTTPPTVAITYPGAQNTLGSLIVEVKGTADDPHFQNYSLERGQEEVNPVEWVPVSSGALPVKDSILGKWNTSGLTGRWTLRLIATDSVGNKSEVKVPVTLVAPAALIKNYDVTPGLISPNIDGKLETTDIKYELGDAADIKIEVADSNKIVKHTHLAAISSAGTYTYNYGGQSDPSGVLLDGVYTVSLIATSSTSSQREAITITVDTTLPLVDMTSPKDKSFLTVADLAVLGTVSDSTMAEYSVRYAGIAGSTLIDQGSQSRTGYTFGSLNAISEGDYTLTVRARDLGENEANKTIAFTIDRTPPVVKLDTPKEGAYYGGTLSALSSQPSASIVITGSLVEKNLDTFSLRYGLGDAPAQWIDLVTGTTVTAYPSSYVWNAGNNSVNDGVYTLSLLAKDKAGLTAEQKVKITIDNAIPTSVITSLHDGDYIKQAVEVRGTAYDLNFDKYVVAISEGQCASAFKWAVIKTGTTAVQDDVLTAWQALPLDGDYCLRVTTTDKVGLTSEAKVNVKVDTHPPAAPVLSGKVDTKINAQLDWICNTEPHVAYNLYRNGVKVNVELVAGCELRDQNLTEGVYAYTVKAVDLAGNESNASNEIKLKIDLIGPDARIRSPHNNGTTSGLIDIKGTAYSADDFKQYRVFIGQGASPSSWTIIRTSPLPTSYGVLAQWDTFGINEGQVYSIKLEAEDLSGNITTHQISVTIDNTAPAAPNLISAVLVTNSSDVALSWLPNTETDLAGYLLYRNNQLANVSGIVVGDLKPYLISALTTTYLDKSLPDGMYTYYLTAMDQAGNISELSSTLTVTIDTHPPHAAIVDPADKTMFGGKIMVKAESPDFDIASVQFQYQSILSSPTTTTDWINLGNPVTTASYITYMDPSTSGLGLAYGDCRLRAVATDKGQKADPTPGFITITYADLTPPVAPQGLMAKTNGGTVTLTWIANSIESDLDGYNVYRTSGSSKTKINTAIVQPSAQPTYPDSGLADGTYTYEITVVDTNKNESSPSGPASAKAYAPVIMQPTSPTAQQTIRVIGSNAAANSPVEIFVEDSAGYGPRGSALTDQVGAFSFDAVLTPGENRITVKVTDNNGNVSKTSAAALVVYDEAPAAPTGLAAFVTDSNVSLTWNENAEADLAGYLVYRNAGQGWVKLTVSAIQSLTYHDADLPNGAYSYYVAAQDHLGSESQPSNEVVATLALDPPLSPELLNVVAMPTGELNILWDHPGTGVAGYTIYRSALSGGPYERLNGSPVSETTYTDTGLVNGSSYFYVVTASDQAGNESAYSDEGSGIPNDSVAPVKPRITAPTVPGSALTVSVARTDVAGISDPATSVELFKNGMSAGTTTTIPGLVQRSFALDPAIGAPALSPNGLMLAYQTNGSLWLQELASATVSAIITGGDSPLWSPDGTRIAYRYSDSNGNYRIGIFDRATGSSAPLTDDLSVYEYTPSWSSNGAKIAFMSELNGVRGIWIKDMTTGGLTQVVQSDYLSEQRISPDGNRLAYFDNGSLFMKDLTTGQIVLVDDNTDWYSIGWAPKSGRAVFVSYRTGEARIYTVDFTTGNQVPVADTVGNVYWPIWSSDGIDIFFSAWDSQNGVDSLWSAPASGEGQAQLIEPGLPGLYYLTAIDNGGVAYVNVEWDADGNPAAANLKMKTSGGTFEFRNISLDQGQNIFAARAVDSAGNASALSDDIAVVFDARELPDLSVSAEDVYLYPTAPIAGERMSINAVISNAGQRDAVDINADLYVWNALGQLQLLKSERIPLIAAGSAALLAAEWDSTGMVGDNRLVVVVDSEDKIAESIESNNMAIKDFYVADHIGMSMTTALDAAQHSSRNANITVTIRNTGPAANAVLDVRIEDANGYLVSLFDSKTLNPAYAKEVNQKYVWNTGSTYAGPYVVHSILKDAAGTMLAENTTPFTIVSDAVAELTVVTDKVAYGPRENVVTSFTIKNTGTNYIIPMLRATVSITDALGTVLYNEIKTASNLLPGASVDLSSLWNTGLTLPGDYNVVVQVSFDGGATKTKSAAFKINTVIVLSGAITAAPSVVPLGNTAQVTYTLANTGNADALEYTTRISILDPETQAVMQTHDELVDIAKNSTKSGQIFVSTNGYGLKTYTAVLQAISQAGTKTIHSASFMVKDLTPPVVTILSPMEGNSYGSTIMILTSVTDNASGVDQVEYKRDNGTWSLLPVSDPARGRFGVTWDPTMDDNGMHRISFRATDKTGNSSESMTVSYEVRINRAPTTPSPASPADGADVGTSLPELIVNNASDPNSDPLTYTFEVYADSDLTVMIVAAGGIAEGTGTTSWQAPQELTENVRYFWRARAFDGKLYGEWMSAVAFRVNAVEDPPSAPVPTSPADGTEAATLTPVLTVINAVDPDSASLTYNFEVALDSDFTHTVTSAPGVSAGQGTTSWQVPVQLEEDRLYYWRAQADDWTVSGPWSVSSSFFVNTGNNAPTVPVVIAPADGVEVTTLSTDIVLQNSTDLDSAVIAYSIELDTMKTFDSPNLLRVTGLPQGEGATAWHVDGLSDNTLYYVRARASDGAAESDWSGVPGFFVNTLNNAPEKPVPANPSDGAGVNVFTPTLSVQNATDLDRDVLTYDFKVYEDAALSILAASVTGVIETQGTTSWTVSVPLKENRTYYWQAQAFDGELASGWTAPLSFTVNTGNDEPTAPTIVSPAEGGSVDIAMPLLTVLNATDLDSSRLTYEFQVFYGSAMIWFATGIEEGMGSTSATLSVPLTDNTVYSWRCRAHDGNRDGAWTAMTKFTVHLPQTGITVDIEFEPETLNQKSKGNWVMVEIELPHGYRASDVDIASIRLEGTVPAVAWPREINKHHRGHGCEQEHGEHDHSELKVKFRRNEAIAVLPAGNHVPVHVTGTVAGTPFEGVDIIRVIR